MATKSLLTLFVLISVLSLASCMYDGGSKVVRLTADNFKSKVINSNEMWFVEFYAPWCGHCKSLEPEFEKLASALDGIINIGAVDMTTDQAAGSSYGVTGFPTLKYFGLDKNQPTDYKGDRSVNDMISFSLRQAKDAAEGRLKGKGSKAGGRSSGSQGGSQGGSHGGSGNEDEVVILTDSNFDELVMGSDDLWLVEFYAPWCGHCQKLEPEWKDAANRLKGEVKLGKVDATVQQGIAGRYQISGYPSIKVFLPGKKSQGNVEDYNGGRDAGTITSYALEKKLQHKPVLKVTQLIDEDIFSQYCVSAKSICLIAFLPHIYDSSAAERNQQVELLQEIQKANRINPVAILWSQGGDQYEFEESLALASGYPSLVAISVNKMKYSSMKGAFTKKNVESYITGLMTGREGLFEMRQVPKVKAVTEWDGQDHQPEYHQEEDL